MKSLYMLENKLQTQYLSHQEAAVREMQNKYDQEAFAALSPIYSTEGYQAITDPNEIVEFDWIYNYDVWDNPSLNPNWRVELYMVGKPAKDATCAWQYFEKPIVKRKNKVTAVTQIRRKFDFTV